MFLEYIYKNYEENQRFHVSVFGALSVHVIIAVWMIMPMRQEIIASDAYSVPTKVSIRFVQPVKDAPVQISKPIEAQKPVIEKIEPKKIVQKPLKPLVVALLQLRQEYICYQ